MQFYRQYQRMCVGGVIVKRRIEDGLLSWKNQKNRKPLIVYGARQVGKTYSIISFGRKNYADYAYFNFEANGELKSIFDRNLEPKRIVLELGAVLGKVITEHTLIIFDEIQAAPKALTSLKYFCEQAPEYHIIAAGSLLGVALERENCSFPVGKVNSINMYPMDFYEFLLATGNEVLADMIEAGYREDSPLSENLHSRALELYRSYLVVGGMPEVVKEFIETDDYRMVRVKQAEIINNYTADMAKYATKNEAIKHVATYNSIPSQLARENKKFQYKLIGSNARSREYEASIDWLSKAGVVLRCEKVNEGKIPLEFYKDITSFKIYFSDVGLLAAKAMIPVENILSDINLGGEAKGAITENYLAVQLSCREHKLYYWEAGSAAELDFVIMQDNRIVLVECKANVHVRAKSLETFRKKYAIGESIRVSAKNFGMDNGIKSVPLYAAWCI